MTNSSAGTPVPAAEALLSHDVLDLPWAVAPQVSVRPEQFGALLYHFGTRRLSFLKDPRLLAVVQSLDTAPTARDACLDAGVDTADLPAFAQALKRLADTDMVRPRSASPASTVRPVIEVV